METKQTKSNWGGRREGAGRKPLGMVRISVYVAPEHRDYVEHLDPDSSLSENMRSILDQVME